MTLNEYKKKMMTDYRVPLNKLDTLGRLLYAALALNGEAGEVAEKVKRIARGDAGHQNATEDIKNGIALELGDVLYCACMVAEELGLDMDYIMDQSEAKFAGRAARGTLKGEGDVR